MRRFLLAATALTVSGFASAAMAAPSVGIRVYQDDVLVADTGLVASGTATVNTATSLFSLYFGLAAGAPQLPQPNFDTQTTTISSLQNFSGTHTVRFEFTQTDLDSSSATNNQGIAQLVSTFTTNALSNGQFVQQVSLASYADLNNDAYGRDFLLGNATYTSGPTNDSGALTSGQFTLPGSLFAETVVISATFTGGGASLNASGQIVAVPEPASLALFGMGLLGLGLSRRRKA